MIKNVDYNNNEIDAYLVFLRPLLVRITRQVYEYGTRRRAIAVRRRSDRSWPSDRRRRPRRRRLVLKIAHAFFIIPYTGRWRFCRFGRIKFEKQKK